MSDLEMQNIANKPRNRRAVVKGAAWSVPVIAAAIAAPAASASDLGALSLDGTCGALGLGLLNTGFTLTASPSAPIPAGTIVTLTGSGLANIGVITLTGGLASVGVISDTVKTVTLDSDLPAGGQLQMKTVVNVSLLWSMAATVALPAGDTATGGKTTASVNGTLVLCTAG